MITLEQISLTLRIAKAAQEMLGQINQDLDRVNMLQVAANSAGKLDILCGEFDILRQELLPKEIDKDMSEVVVDDVLPAAERFSTSEFLPLNNRLETTLTEFFDDDDEELETE